jgi:hypothetical protein
LKGDYFNDPKYRQLFCEWLNKIWTKKDERIELIKTD